MKKNTMLHLIVGILCAGFLTQFSFASSEVKVASSDSQKAPEKFIAQEGTIASVSKEGDHWIVDTWDGKSGMVFMVQDSVFVLDQKSGELVTLDHLKKDMSIVAVLPQNSPVTLSLPPQTSSAVGFVIKSGEGSVDVSLYDQALTNSENTLMLHIGDNTKIFSIHGIKKLFTGEDIKGCEALVLYTASTRSIPAQTTPEVVMLLQVSASETSSEKTPDATLAEPEKSAPAKPPSYVELRTAAEAKGYSLQWISKKQPIGLTKGDMQIQITLGSQDFAFTHKTRDIKALDRMKKLDLPPILKNNRTMVPQSFIDALE